MKKNASVKISFINVQKFCVLTLSPSKEAKSTKNNYVSIVYPQAVNSKIIRKIVLMM